MEEIKSIWTEKYRPKMLGEVVGQKHVTEKLKRFVQERSLPHCLFAGSAGIGKTTCALAIARELYGDGWRNYFLELNASDSRGIDTIRIQVKDFARTMSLSGMFKIIYLDEADSLTRDAQHALRRTMEKYSNTARFILSVNYSSKIIQPIQSRTAVFRFLPLKEEEVIGYLKQVADKEQLQVEEDAYRAIMQLSEGDMRKSINLLQMASADGDVTEDKVIALSHHDPKTTRKMLSLALQGQFKEARECLLSLFMKGFGGEDIIKDIYSQVFALDTEDMTKLKLLERIGEYEFRLTEGSNPRIQLEALLAQIGLLKEE